MPYPQEDTCLSFSSKYVQRRFASENSTHIGAGFCDRQYEQSAVCTTTTGMPTYSLEYLVPSSRVRNGWGQNRAVCIMERMQLFPVLGHRIIRWIGHDGSDRAIGQKNISTKLVALCDQKLAVRDILALELRQETFENKER